MRELVQPGGSKRGLPSGLLCGTSGNRKLCMARCHFCHMYVIGRSKEVGDALKPSFGVAMQATTRDRGIFNREGGGSHYVILLY